MTAPVWALQGSRGETPRNTPRTIPVTSLTLLASTRSNRNATHSTPIAVTSDKSSVRTVTNSCAII